MPLAAILVGTMLVVLAFRGTEHNFAKLLGQDFGQGSQFWSWAVALGVLGTLGYVDALKRFSNLFLGLVIVVLVLKNGGLFTQLAAVVRSPPKASAPISIASYKNSDGSGGTSSSKQASSSSGGDDTQAYIDTALTIVEFAALAA